MLIKQNIEKVEYKRLEEFPNAQILIDLSFQKNMSLRKSANLIHEKITELMLIN